MLSEKCVRCVACGMLACICVYVGNGIWVPPNKRKYEVPEQAERFDTWMNRAVMMTTSGVQNVSMWQTPVVSGSVVSSSGPVMSG